MRRSAPSAATRPRWSPRGRASGWPLIAALQYLPPRQRAVLVLREVLRWRAAEVAQALGITTVAVNSTLQRARAQLATVNPSPDDLVEPSAARQRELLDRYLAAFEAKDIPAIVALFTRDAVWEMPPFLSWFRGPERIGALIDTHCPADGPGAMRLLPVRANGQPAFGLYIRAPDGSYRAFNLPVLTLTEGGVSRVTCFFDLSLFPLFGLPPTLPAAAAQPQPTTAARPSPSPSPARGPSGRAGGRGGGLAGRRSAGARDRVHAGLPVPGQAGNAGQSDAVRRVGPADVADPSG